MKFNFVKCHSMRVTRHYAHLQILYNYTLHQRTLENVKSANYHRKHGLGQHISDISSKATKTSCFLCRNLAFAPRNAKDSVMP